MFPGNNLYQKQLRLIWGNVSAYFRENIEELPGVLGKK